MLLGEYASTVPKSPLEFSKTIEASNGQGCESKQAVAWDAPKTFPFASLISTITDSSGTLARPLILTGDEICDLPCGAVISTPKFTEDVSAPACGWTLGRGPFAFDSPKVEGNFEIGLGVGDGVICVSSFCFCHAQYIPVEPTAKYSLAATWGGLVVPKVLAPQHFDMFREDHPVYSWGVFGSAVGGTLKALEVLVL